MKQIFVFDIDGTLTKPRNPMDLAFSSYFKSFCQFNDVYLCTGSDFDKVLEQVPVPVLSLVKGIFTCSGNSYWFGRLMVCQEDVSQRNLFDPPPELIESLENYVKMSKFEPKTENFVEFRTGMINFSTVGRSCDQKTRDSYAKWDEIEGERTKIAKEMKEKFPDLDFNIGGEISIDIHPKGWDKSQAIRKIKDWFPNRSIHFFGDKIKEGGNDLPAAKALGKNDSVHPVEGPDDTRRILECFFDSRI